MLIPQLLDVLRTFSLLRNHRLLSTNLFMHKGCDSHVKIVLYFIITIPKVIYKIYDTNHNGCRDLELLRFREGCTCFRVSGVGLIAPCSKLGIEIISKHSGSTISVIAADQPCDSFSSGLALATLSGSAL